MLQTRGKSTVRTRYLAFKQLSDSPWAQMKAGGCARKLQPSTFLSAFSS
jgi:hypothetical protein